MSFLELCKKYEGNPVARVIVNAIPYVGGSIDAGLSNIWSNYHNKRIESFLLHVDKELAEIKYKSIDVSLLESEYFYDIVYKIVADVLSSRCEQKRILYAKIIRSALLSDQSKHSIEELVSQVAEMKELDYIVLETIKLMYDKGVAVSGNSLSSELSHLGYTMIEVENLLYRYENMMLLDHDRNTLWARGRTSFYRTKYFDKLSEYLQW